MAASPRWKLYNAEGAYVASSHDLALFAAGIGLYGAGATIRDGHKLVCWTEGSDGVAYESYDHVSDVCLQRAKAAIDAKHAKTRAYLASLREVQS